MSEFNKYKGKKVLITGHTGFKGSWLSLWLNYLGAKCIGISLDHKISDPSHYDVANMDTVIDSYFLDITDNKKVQKILEKERPDYIFHMAAQALVRPAYEDPYRAIFSNALGTASILEAVRCADFPVTMIMITSDKVYNNVEWNWGYRETDELGGKDPYSASKGMAELAIKTYFESYFKENSKVKLGIARAGNVIGGGDWAKDRIVPDCMRAWSKGEKVSLRNPKATRPWQHVLEPLSGYLSLALKIEADNDLNGEAYNFGPNSNQDFSVGSLIQLMSDNWEQVDWEDVSSQNHIHEAGLLKLNCDKALAELSWLPVLKFEETVKFTVNWYKNFYEQEGQANISSVTLGQIEDYMLLAKNQNIAWAKDS